MSAQTDEFPVDEFESRDPSEQVDASNGKDSVEAEDGVDQENLEKEQSIWDAFREEYYEGELRISKLQDSQR